MTVVKSDVITHQRKGSCRTPLLGFIYNY